MFHLYICVIKLLKATSFLILVFFCFLFLFCFCGKWASNLPGGRKAEWLFRVGREPPLPALQFPRPPLVAVSACLSYPRAFKLHLS